MNPTLSILIPTVIDRLGQFTDLWLEIDKEAKPWGDAIQMLAACDNKEMPIGEKRNRLYKDAAGLYSVQIDDDDKMEPGWINTVMTILTMEHYDCVTYQEKCLIDGKEFTSNHSLKYADWYENMDGYDYVRAPFMKDIIRTDICKAVPVPPIRFGEDHQWSRLIKPHLRNEFHIDQQLYHYIHNSTPHTERYGLDKE